MSDILARNLGGKHIVGIDGTDFGTLHTITMDPKSGTLRDLVVDSHSQPSSAPSIRSDADDRLRIPVSRIETVNDQIVVRSGD
ncbi:PRC-barrel domain-containing protein [Natrinema halophilum]|uniref:PRC-barrel domain-containing protein n=1 Tax=Natrinema halophilum TaxID=1699371 RepID=A0A7D5GJV8_9EURY|nr:PRC-barrel domain-containing protein [Natrinema halophilum]QLG48730.1 PRC-barrel domain-containing protein [Natrinema halophilum]